MCKQILRTPESGNLALRRLTRCSEGWMRMFGLCYSRCFNSRQMKSKAEVIWRFDLHSFQLSHALGKARRWSERALAETSKDAPLTAAISRT